MTRFLILLLLCSTVTAHEGPVDYNCTVTTLPDRVEWACTTAEAGADPAPVPPVPDTQPEPTPEVPISAAILGVGPPVELNQVSFAQTQPAPDTGGTLLLCIAATHATISGPQVVVPDGWQLLRRQKFWYDDAEITLLSRVSNGGEQDVPTVALNKQAIVRAQMVRVAGTVTATGAGAETGGVITGIGAPLQIGCAASQLNGLPSSSWEDHTVNAWWVGFGSGDTTVTGLGARQGYVLAGLEDG